MHVVRSRFEAANGIFENKKNAPLSVAFQKLINCGANNFETNNLVAFDAFVHLFSIFVTRHEKSQLVGGAVALCLPSKVCKVVTLKMSSKENEFFQKSLSLVNKSVVAKYRQAGAASFKLEGVLIHPLSSDKLFTEWNKSTKICALLQEMKSLQQHDHNFRAVVYTQYSHTHTEVVKALKKSFIIPVVYEITGSTSSTDRDFAIRTFQGPRAFPACIVVTLRSGSVGMTLTQASNLYLMEPSLDPAAEIQAMVMEPSLDPAAEIQAMGRIHRLGQLREVEMKKFVFADTVESNIVALHKEIDAGRLQMQKTKVSAHAAKLTKGLSFS